jgi:HK97 family phage major capsid protein
LVRSDITKVLALAIDLACIHGTGSNNQPLGLLADLDANLSDNIVAMGENGAAPTFAKMVELETMIAAGNADIGSLCYCTNPQVRGTLKTTEKDVTGNYPVYIWEPGNTVNGYRTEVSNQVSHTLTKGTSDSVCSAMMFGNWADCLLGLWGTLDLLVDPYTGATSGTVRVVALQSVDIVRRRLESFSAIVDLLTA